MNLFAKRFAADLYQLLGDIKLRYTIIDGISHRLRAVVTTYPGGAPQLWIEHWLPGDECEPWQLKSRQEVTGPWCSDLEIIDWDDDGILHLHEPDMGSWHVTARPGHIETKARDNGGD